MKLIYSILVLILFAGLELKAQNKTDVKSLLQRVTILEDSLSTRNRLIEKLKSRVEMLSQMADNKKAKTNADWRKLERYMSSKEVKKLLGEPTAIDESSSSIRFWYGNGFINFNAFKRVTDWSEPRDNRIEMIER